MFTEHVLPAFRLPELILPGHCQDSEVTHGHTTHHPPRPYPKTTHRVRKDELKRRENEIVPETRVTDSM